MVKRFPGFREAFYFYGMKYFFLASALFLSLFCSSQIVDSVFAANYGPFSIRLLDVRDNKDKGKVHNVFRNDTLVIRDTVFTDKKTCAGFAFPTRQPFSEYFIFSKHQKGNGKTYILSKHGEATVINGGTFWAAPKDQLLFLLAERDLTNLVIYDFRQKKVLLEKFNCDEFDEWYLKKGNYLGVVVMECGTEPELEREVNEWMRPVEVEKYEPKTNKLYEAHVTAHELEKAPKLVR